MSKGPVTVDLSCSTIFPDWNKANQLDPHKSHELILVQPMKHKHFRKMEMLPDSKKMNFLMEALTGLSCRDLDELDIDDSAELTKVIMGYMKKYVELAKEMSL